MLTLLTLFIHFILFYTTLFFVILLKKIELVYLNYVDKHIFQKDRHIWTKLFAVSQSELRVSVLKSTIQVL